jgi:hypothetical protein
LRAAVVVRSADSADTVEDVLLPLGVTKNSYAVARASPVTVQCCVPVGGVTVLTTVQLKAVATSTSTASVNAFTVYVVATESAVNETRIEVAPAFASVTPPMAIPGIKAAEAEDTVEVVPPPLGVTVKVYDVPFVIPATTQDCAPAPIGVRLARVQVKLPGVDVTV